MRRIDWALLRMLSEIWARAFGAGEELDQALGELGLREAGDFALDERLAFAVLVFPGLHGQVAGLGEGGADISVLGSEGGGVEVDFHERFAGSGSSLARLRPA